MTVHSDEAERGLLATLLTDPSRVTDVLDLVDGGSFYRPSHGHLFEVIRDMRQAGHLNGWGSVEVVAAELRRRGHEASATDLTALSSEADMHHRQHAAEVQRCAYARRALGVADAIQASATSGATPDELVGEMRDLVSGIDAPVTMDKLDGLWTVDGLVDSPHHQSTRWLVPGLVGEQWRIMLIAEEGAGKSYLTRTVAAAAAQGVHPFQRDAEPYQPVPSLVVDLENPLDVISGGFRQVTHQTRRDALDYDEERSWVWSQPGGIDLRKRSDRGRLEAVIAATQPRVLVLSPLYKAYLSSARESDEQVAREVIGVLDEIRTRFDVALIVEHHAPKGGPGVRQLDPFGSSLWKRWPEMGLSLEKDESTPGALFVKRHRFDRVKNRWPTHLTRGDADGWPFNASWERAS